MAYNLKNNFIAGATSISLETNHRGASSIVSTPAITQCDKIDAHVTSSSVPSHLSQDINDIILEIAADAVATVSGDGDGD